jgi:NADPH:quinone reductase-like Zn-dependent oxidoreductase
MKSALVSSFGGPDVLVVVERALRPAQPHEAVVRVEAAGVNPLDLKMIAGYLQQVFPVEMPYAPGTDFSGVVESVGAQAPHLKVGDRVLGRTPPGSGGAFAERLVIAAADLQPMPPEMGFEQAACLPTAFGTARQALFETGRLARGQRVLVHAGAGGVGSMAVQLAHLAGAHVLATASAPNLELVRSLGADEVIDYRVQDFGRVRDIDLVLDTIGGETLEKSWSVLRPGGRIASIVEFGIQPQSGQAGEFVFFASATPFLPEAVRLFAAGSLQTVIDSIFPLDETRAALEKVATGHARGKVLVRVGG